MASQHTAVVRTGALTTTAARAQSVRASSPATFRGGKRPSSPASFSPVNSSPASCSPVNSSPASSPATPASNNNNNKKRKAVSVATPTRAQIVIMETPSEVNAHSGLDVAVPTTSEPLIKPPAFKDPNFTHSGIGGAAAGKKNRTWKNLKQILSVERTFPWNMKDPSYYNIDAPSSFKPAKKYSDISGLPANYTDPQTKLRFTSSDEFTYIRLLPTDVVTGYLALRKATCVVP